MSETYSYNPDKLTNEARDTLRMELETISPAEREVMNQIIGEYNERYIHWYGNNITNQLTNEQMQKVFIFNDKLTLTEFIESYWGANVKIKDADHSYASVAHNFNTIFFWGDVIAIGHIPDNWENIPPEGREKMIADVGDEGLAKESLHLLTSQILLSHEMAHIYGNPELPITIKEAGAQWYAEKGVRLNGEPHAEALGYMKLVEYYQLLLDKYGDKIHELYFSETFTDKQKKLLDEIMADEPEGLFDDFREDNEK